MTAQEPPKPDEARAAAGGPPNDNLVGKLLVGRYRVERVLAQGGMGRVYIAVQEPLGRRVALKTLLRPDDASDAFRKRFELEAAVLSKLRHPNTVTVFDYGFAEEEGLFYMVMELVDGEPLSKIMRRDGPLEPARALAIAHEVCRSLAEAHAQGVVHRDLKPSNVMIVQTREGEGVKVVDFGIVKVLEAEDDLTQADKLVGSPRYMAPEQIRHEPLDGRADLYAVGVLLFEMIAGRSPFAADSTVATLVAHLQRPAPALTLPDGTTPPGGTAALVARLLAKSPSDRPESADALRELLRAVLGELGAYTGPISAPTGARTRPDTAELEAAPAAAPPQDPTLLTGGRSVPTGTRSAAPSATARWALAFGAVLVAVVLLALALRAPAPVDEGASGSAADVGAAAPAAPPAQAVQAPPREVPASPPALAPLLVLRSDPAGARILVDGVEQGTTPAPLPWTATRTAVVRLELDGYEPAEFEVEPLSGDAQRAVTLTPVSAAPAARPKPKPKPDDGLLLSR